MASKEYIQERIAKASETISKKENTISKKEKQIAKKEAYLNEKYGITSWKEYDRYSREGKTEEVHNDIYWTICDIEHLEDDINRGKKEIAAKEISLEKYQAELQNIIEKENSRNVTVILDFLDKWKVDCKGFYLKAIEPYYLEKEKVRDLSKRASESWQKPNHDVIEKEYQEAMLSLRNKIRGYFRPITEEEKKSGQYRWQSEIKIKEGEWEYAKMYLSHKNKEEALAALQKDLNHEANRKYDDIIERTNSIVGEITDCSQLRINAKGNLDGIIIGTRGQACVQTVGAGGYNIQCFHFRTLITEMNVPESLELKNNKNIRR